jgi:hypothetical protein
MATVAMHPERRRFSRISYHRPAELIVGGTSTRCAVQDVSLRGALVGVPFAFVAEADTRCTLVIWLDPAEAAIRMDGIIAHHDGASVGVRCTGIDLESIAHLRRLVELNLGDEVLLHRELAALVGA